MLRRAGIWMHKVQRTRPAELWILGIRPNHYLEPFATAVFGLTIKIQVCYGKYAGLRFCALRCDVIQDTENEVFEQLRYRSTGYFPTQGPSVLSRSTLLAGDYRSMAPDC